MAEIQLADLTKRFGDLAAVDGLTLTIPDKEFVALLGPSGCGKTTTMNMIAGIETPSAGDIRFDGRSVRGMPPGRRGVGFVFQSYAIFTHLSVYENLAFGLRVRRRKHSEVDRRVREIAALMRLEDRLDVPSARLSVNELQKLAIGRSAIVEPSIFLLDEPLSNLDASFREFMRTELKHIQHELRQTMVYVTHDQIEAMSLADRIAVMDLGRLQQYGPPNEVYNRPANTFVANFMGSPSMNLIPCSIREEHGRTWFEVGAAGRIEVHDASLLRAARSVARREALLGVRPEVLQVTAAGDGEPGSAADTLTMELDLLEPVGPRTIVHLRAGATELVAVEGKDCAVAVNRPARVRLPQEACHLFDRQTGRALGRDPR